MNHLRKLVLGWLAILLVSMPARSQEPTMVGHYIDVGQGLSVLLEFPCGAVLIDTGGQDIEHLDYLHGYLADFFTRRADLKNTLNTMFITHPHVDHALGIETVTKVCRVKNFVENGVTDIDGKGFSGSKQVGWMRANAGMLGVKLRQVKNDEIEALPDKTGLTDAAIDDIKCPTCDPKIVVLSGGRGVNPGWTKSDFGNANNHSLVIRVDFGKSSFLFTGDLEEPAINKLLDYYGGTKMLRANVQQVGHHGSANGTTRGLVEAVRPDIAVIGMGKWDFGMDKKGGFTTFSFGHPRHQVVDLFSELIPGFRPTPLTTKVFDGVARPVDYTVRKSIYGTGWDGDVKVSAKLDGSFKVMTRNEAARAHFLGKSNPDKRLTNEMVQPHDSVTPELAEPPRPQGWNCPPRRLLFRRR
jgi:competence protein ComEC